MSYLPGSFAIVFFLQSQSNSSPVPLALLILTIIGAVADYKYKKAGGRRPSKMDRILMLVMTLIVVGFIVWADSINPAIAGEAAVPLVVFLLFAWELGRWRMRRKYPLPVDANKLPKPALVLGPVFRFVVALGLVALVVGGSIYAILESDFVYHDKMATVYFRNWTNSEYKTCDTANENKDRPDLYCEQRVGDEGKIFKVRFHGHMYAESLPIGTLLHWNCIRNSDGEPVFTCKRDTSLDVAEKPIKDSRDSWVVVDDVGTEHRFTATDKDSVQTMCESHPAWKVIHDPITNGGEYLICPAWIDLFGSHSHWPAYSH